MGLLEDLKNGDVKSIILVILFIFIFNLYWCISKSITQNQFKESMTNVSNDINAAISRIYKADVEAIRNLADLSKKIQDKSGLTLPGNLTVQGSFNYLPRGTIVAYNETSAPSGWTLCNGSNGSPDLRGRFIFGNGGSRGMNTTGGAETVALATHQMPAHSHVIDANGNHNHGINSDWIVWPPGTYPNSFGGGNRTSGDRSAQGFARLNQFSTHHAGQHSHHIHNTGGGQAHENMPPFYVLTYIMKL
jgi:microcystin-dependent protein